MVGYDYGKEGEKRTGEKSEKGVVVKREQGNTKNKQRRKKEI